MTNAHTATNDPHELGNLAERARQVLDRVDTDALEESGVSDKIRGAAEAGGADRPAPMPEPEVKPVETSDAIAEAAMAGSITAAAAAAATARAGADSEQFVSKIAEAAQAAAVPRTVINEPTEPDAAPETAAAAPASAETPNAPESPGTELAVYDGEESGGFPLIWLVLIGVLIGALVMFGDDLWNATFGDDSDADSPAAVATEDDANGSSESAGTEASADAPATAVLSGARLSNEPFTTMWEALTAQGEATSFLAMARSLGLEDDLNSATDADGRPVRRTLFAPTDEAIAALSPARLNHLAVTPADAEALIGYHMLDLPLTSDQLAGTAGTPLPSILGGLQLSLSVDDQGILLNREARIVKTDIRTDNGIVHMIDVVLEPPTVNEAIGLNSIGFEFSSATITPEGRTELLKAVNFFEQFPLGAVIEGHTDTDGQAIKNLQLSQARADAVKAFLVDHGIEPTRLTAIGFGETRPIYIGEPVEGVEPIENKAASRRIEFVVR